MTQTLRILLGAVALLAFSGANAGDMYPWRNNAAPYPFLFGNDFDTHQQSRVRADGSLDSSMSATQGSSRLTATR